MGEQQILTWISEKWPMMATLLGIVVVGVRNEATTRQLQRAVFRHDGDLRLVRVDDCIQCRRDCHELLARDAGLAREDFKRVEKKLDGLIEYLMKGGNLPQ